MGASPEPVVRHADTRDADVVGQLLDALNREYNEPTPGSSVLARRIRKLLDSGDTIALLAGDGPDGLAILRFRPSIWYENSEAYLAELYVVPQRRGQGLGRSLISASIREARDWGAGTIDLGTSESDTAGRNLYESLGFTNREDEGKGALMYFYQREL